MNPAQEALEPIDPLELLLKRMKDDTNYLANILFTLEINKLEAAHQDRTQPAIFLKVTDDLGIISNCKPNPASTVQLELPPGEYTAVDIKQFLDRLEKDAAFVNRLVLMLTTGHIEYTIHCTVEVPPESKPVLAKQFDEYGLPTSYAMNWPVERLTIPKLKNSTKKPKRRRK